MRVLNQGRCCKENHNYNIIHQYYFNVLCLLKQCFLIKCNIGPLYTAPDTWDTDVHYINTSEIPGELSCENMISSHVKITCYLHKRKDHRCYGYIINCTFLSKKIFKWNGLAFHWCLHNKIIEHYMAAWRCEFSLLVLKNISLIRCTQGEILYLRGAM